MKTKGYVWIAIHVSVFESSDDTFKLFVQMERFVSNIVAIINREI